MSAHSFRVFAITLCALGLCLKQAHPQDPARVAAVPSTPAATAPKFTFILFWKDNTAATQDMAARLKAAVAKRSHQVEFAAVKANDPANLAVVERYHVSRAPMPLALCVAPNGAITGAIPDRVTDEAIEKVLVTPAMTHCMKALQEGKLVLVHVKPEDRSAMPGGANQFATDPEFKARTTMVSLLRDDPNEARFISDMEIAANARGSIVSLLAPPGVLVGKFTTASTKEDIASALHAAGKCCDDPNCIHNKKGK